MLEFSVHKLQFYLCISRFPIPQVHFAKISERRNKRKEEREGKGRRNGGKRGDSCQSLKLALFCLFSVLSEHHVLKLIFPTSKVSLGWDSMLTSPYPIQDDGYQTPYERDPFCPPKSLQYWLVSIQGELKKSPVTQSQNLAKVEFEFKLNHTTLEWL